MSNEHDWQGAFTGHGIDKTMDERRSYEQSERWIVEPILPAGAMHLLGGPSGAGKTTWLLQFLWEWEQGLPIFGQYASNPVPWVYICCDRSLRETTKTIQRLDYHKWEFEAYSLEQLLSRSAGKFTESPDIIKHVLNRFPGHELYVIEGLQALMPDIARGRSQNKAELLWALGVRDLIGPANKTIIATTHNPKVSAAGGMAVDARSKFLGSQGFIGTCSTMVGFEKDDKKPDVRNVKVMGRNFRDIDLVYSLDSRGRFVLDATIDKSGKTVYETDDDREIAILTYAQGAERFTSREARLALAKLDISKTTMYRILTQMVAEGTLDAESEGQTIWYIYMPVQQ